MKNNTSSGPFRYLIKPLNISKLLLTLFLVTLFTQTSFSDELKNWNEHYNQDQDVWIELKGNYNDRDTWIGIYPAGTNSDWDNVISWRRGPDKSITKSEAHRYQNWYKFPDSMIDDEMNISKTKDYNNSNYLPEGRYIARLFFNNSYNVESSISFSVGDAKPDSSLIADTDYQPDVWIKLRNNASLNEMDWIGIYPANKNIEWKNVIAWRWAKDEESTAIEAGHWFKFPDSKLRLRNNNYPNKGKISIPNGNYVARFFLNNSYKVETSVFFKVKNQAPEKVYPTDVVLNNKALKRRAEKHVTEPSVGESYVDKAFDSQVTRTVTRVTNRTKDARDAEAKDKYLFSNYHPEGKQGTAWNSDMSLFKLHCHLYNADSLKELKLTNTPPNGKSPNALMLSPSSGCTSGMRWSKHNPNDLFVITDDNKFVRLTLTDNKSQFTSEEIFDFNTVHVNGLITPKYNIGSDEGNIDYNDEYVVLSAHNKGNTQDTYVTLLKIGKKGEKGKLIWGPKKFEDAPKGKFDWISISPSGKYILVSTSEGNDGKIILYDRNLNRIRTLANFAEHGDIGYTSNNQEMYVQFQKSGGGIWGFVLNDNKDQNSIQLLDSNYGGGHIACRNYKRKGWCYVGTEENGYREVFAVKLVTNKNDKTVVEHFAQSHNPKNWTPYVNVSPDGTRVLFMSDFNNNRDDKDWLLSDTYHVKISK